MNGPDHFREAEKYLTFARNEEDHESPSVAYYLTRAQVHATLALVAATATQLVGQFVELEEDAFAWSKAACTPPRGVEDVHLP